MSASRQVCMEQMVRLTRLRGAPDVATDDGVATAKRFLDVMERLCCSDEFAVAVADSLERRLKFFPTIADIHETVEMVRAEMPQPEPQPVRPTVCNECGDSGWCPMVRGTNGWRPWSLEIDGSSVVPTTRRCGCQRKQGAA